MSTITLNFNDGSIIQFIDERQANHAMHALLAAWKVFSTRDIDSVAVVKHGQYIRLDRNRTPTGGA